jgi:hypothetical protein
VSPFVGVACKHQSLLGIPTPSRDVTGRNIGVVAGAEGEWRFARFISAFAGVNYRTLLLKEACCDVLCDTHHINCKREMLKGVVK